MYVTGLHLHPGTFHLRINKRVGMQLCLPDRKDEAMNKVLVLLVVVLGWCMVGCGDNGEAGPSPDGDAVGPCTDGITISALPDTTSEKELLVTFDVEACAEPIRTWIVNNDRSLAATPLSPGRYRRYVSMNPGENRIHVMIRDANGAQSSSGTYTVTYDETAVNLSAGAAMLHGSVFEEGSETPIEGALAYIRGIEGVATSDANGAFSLPAPEGRSIVTIEKPGYTLAQRWNVSRAGGQYSLAPAYLVKADSKVVTFKPGQPSELVNSVGDINVKAPAGAVAMELDVSATSFPKYRSLPGELPDSSGWTQALEVFPEGAVFDEPVMVRQENINNFPPGFHVPVGYYNRDKGAWEAQGMAVVSADGQWLDFETDHFSPYDINSPVSPRDQAGNGNSNKDDCDKGSAGSSIVDDLGGQLTLYHPADSYTENNEVSTLFLSYNSGRAAGEVDVVIPVDTNATDAMERMEASLDFAGNRKEVSTEATEGGQYMIAARFFNRSPDQTVVENGVVPVRMELTKYERSTYMSATGFGSGGLEDSGVPTREALPYKVRKAIPAIVEAGTDSPYGAGWDLSMREWLTFDDDLGLGLWHRGGRRPVPFITGLPGSDPIDLPIDAGMEIEGMILDSQGHVFILGDYRELFVAESLQQVDNAQEIDPGDADIHGFARHGDTIYGIGDEAELYTVEYPGTVTLLWNLGQEYIMQQVWQQGAMQGMDVMYPDAGFAMDRDGYFWVMAVGIVFTEDESFYTTMPKLIRADISGPTLSFETYVLMNLSEYVAPGTMVYDAEEHALYYIFYAEDTLRRFDIAGMNESIVMKEDSFSTDDDIKMIRSTDGETYLATGETLLRISKEGLVTVLAESEMEQMFTFDCRVEGFGLDENGQVIFASYDTLRNRLGLTYPDYNRGYFRDLPHRITRTGSGSVMAGAGMTRQFDAGGNITSLIGANGRTASYTWDGDMLTRYESPHGQVTRFGYAGGKLQTITDQTDRVRSVAIDSNNLLTSITDADGMVTSFDYDSQGRMTARHGGAGRIDYSYDAQGSVYQITLDTGETRNFSSILQAVGEDGIGGEDACWATMIDGEGHVHATRYGMNGQPDRYRLNEEEFEIRREVNIVNGDLMATVLKGEEEIVQSIVDSKGRLVSRTEYGVLVATSVFDEDFDEEDHELRGQACTVYYEADSTEYYCDDRTVIMYHDARGYVSQVEDDYSEIYDVETDDRGNITKITDPLGYETIATRDAAGNITGFTNTGGYSTTYTYSHGNVVNSVTDASGAGFEGTISRSATCEGCETSGRDMLQQVTDPFDKIWSAEILADGNIGSLTTPLGNTTTYTYSGNRQLASVTDADGQLATYTYTARNRLATLQVGLSLTTYEYNDRDHMVRAESPDYLITWDRDYDTNEVIETLTDKNSGDTRWISIIYDPETGEETTFATSFGETWTLQHHSHGGTDTTINDGTLQVRSETWAGKLSSVTVTNQSGDWMLGESMVLDEIQRLDYIGWATELDSGYLTSSYPGGCRSASSVASDSPMLDSCTYTHDSLGRLAGWNGVASTAFTYDAGGRLATSTFAGTFSYDDDWRVQENGLARYNYHKSGARSARVNKQSGHEWTYTFNAIGQLIMVEKFSSEAISTPYSTIRLYYDPLFRLARVDVDTVSTYYQWYDYVLIAEYNTVGTVIRSYIPSVGLDGVAVIKQEEESLFPLIDTNGSVLRLFNRFGAVVASYAYDPYGRIVSETGGMATQPRRFAGALWLEDIGLYYMRTRYMDPEIGQFISPDPTWKLKLEPYMYCDGRPCNCTDPMGLEGGAGAAASFVGGQLKGGAQGAMGPAGTAWQVYDAFSGYKRGDANHNAKHGMRKVAGVTFLNLNPTYRKAMDNMDGFFDMMSDDKKGDDEKEKPDPCD